MLLSIGELSFTSCSSFTIEVSTLISSTTEMPFCVGFGTALAPVVFVLRVIVSGFLAPGFKAVIVVLVVVVVRVGGACKKITFRIETGLTPISTVATHFCEIF